DKNIEVLDKIYAANPQFAWINSRKQLLIQERDNLNPKNLNNSYLADKRNNLKESLEMSFSFIEDMQALTKCYDSFVELIVNEYNEGKPFNNQIFKTLINTKNNEIILRKLSESLGDEFAVILNNSSKYLTNLIFSALQENPNVIY